MQPLKRQSQPQRTTQSRNVNRSVRPQMDNDNYQDACQCVATIDRLLGYYEHSFPEGFLKKRLEASHAIKCKTRKEWIEAMDLIFTQNEQTINKNPVFPNDTVAFHNELRDYIARLGTEAHQRIHEDYLAQPWYRSWTFIKIGIGIVGVIVANLVGWGIGALIRKIRKRPEPQSYENKHTGRRVTRRMLAGQMYTQNNEDVENVLRTNMARINLVINNEVQSNGANILCVGGDVFVSPKHYWCMFSQIRNKALKENVPFKLQLRWINGSITDVDWDSIVLWQPQYQHTGDIMFFRIKRLCAHRDISNLFRSVSKSVITYGSYLFGLRSRTADVDGKPTTALLDIGSPTIQSCTYPATTGVMQYFHAPFEKEYIECDQIFVYDRSMTHAGDCGMLLLHTDETVPGKVYGLHVAGSQSMSYGYAAPLYKEDIIEARQHFQSNGDVIPQMEPPTRFSSARVPKSKLLQDVRDTGIEVIGSLQNEFGQRISVTLPRKNKVKKSIVFDLMEEDFGECKYAPTALTPFKNEDGITIKPLQKALAKLTNYTHMLPENIEKDIVDHIVCTIETLKSPIEKRLLTDYEMVNGNSWTNRLDMTTSPGFPYVSMRSGTKASWFDQKVGENYEYEYTPKEYLMNEYNDRIEKAKAGIMKETYFIVTLKDETREIPKVKEGKTRLFQNGPVDFTMAMRKYFGAWIEHCHFEGTNREFSQGMNPNSVDWTVSAQYLQETGNKHRPGDYKNFDSTASCQSGFSYAEAANRWYNDSRENQTIRYVLAATAVFSLQIVDDIVLLFRQGNPSGWRGTTHFNDFNNMRYHRYAFRVLTPFKMSSYFVHNRAKFGGDDNVATWSEQALEYITPTKWTELLAKIGVTYTDAFKNDTIVEDQPFHEITFMKRKWVLDKDRNIYLAPLEFSVIDNIPRWSESNPMNMEDQIQRFNSCLLELTNYGQEKFYQYRNKFIEYCGLIKKNGIDINASRLFTWVDCDKIKYPHLYDAICTTSLPIFSSFRPSENSTDCGSHGAHGHVGKHEDELSDSIVLNSDFYKRTGNSLHKTVEPQSGSQKHVATRQTRRIAKPHADAALTAEYLHEVAERYADMFGEKLDVPAVVDIKPQMENCVCQLDGIAAPMYKNITLEIGPLQYIKPLSTTLTDTFENVTTQNASSTLSASVMLICVMIVIFFQHQIKSLIQYLYDWFRLDKEKVELEQMEARRQERLLHSYGYCTDGNIGQCTKILPQMESEAITTYAPLQNLRDPNEIFTNDKEYRTRYCIFRWISIYRFLYTCWRDFRLVLSLTRCEHEVCRRLIQECTCITKYMDRCTEIADSLTEFDYNLEKSPAIQKVINVDDCEKFVCEQTIRLAFWMCELEILTRELHFDHLGDTDVDSELMFEIRTFEVACLYMRNTLLDKLKNMERIMDTRGLERIESMRNRIVPQMDNNSPPTMSRALSEGSIPSVTQPTFTIEMLRRAMQRVVLAVNAQLEQEEADIEKENPGVSYIKVNDTLPQMDTPSESGSNVTNTTEQITTYVDKNEHHPLDLEHVGRRLKNTFPRTDLESLLNRPYPIGEFIWRSTQTTGVELFRIKLPEDILPSIYAFLIKTTFWSPSFELEFRINAAPQQYGTIIICPYPQGAMIDPQFFNLNAACTGEWAKLRAGANQVVTVKLNYMHYMEKVRVPPLGQYEVKDNIWYVNGYVLSPLSSIAGTSQDVSVSVYARIVNPGLQGHSTAKYGVTPHMMMIDDDTGSVQGSMNNGPSREVRPPRQYPKHVSSIVRNKREEAARTKDGERTGTLSKALSIAGNAGLALAPIPEVGWILGGIGGVLKGASWIASYFGLSMNQNLSTPQPMFRRGPLAYKPSDLHNAIGPSLYDSNVGKDFSLVNGSIDEMSLLHYAQRPCITRLVRFDGNKKPGDVISVFACVPQVVEMGTPVSGMYTLSCWREVCSYVQYWRGSMCFNLSFVCTPFHSCRIRISYIPLTENWQTPRTDKEIFDTVGMVVDITKDTEVNFSVPWFSLQHMHPAKHTDIWSDAPFGYIEVRILNRVVDGNLGSSPIWMEATTFAGADAQFFGYKPLQMFYNYTPNQFRHVQTRDEGADDVEPQMDVNTGKCELPSSSYSCLSRQMFPPLGGIESGYTTGDINCVEEIISWKQLMNMATRTYTVESAFTDRNFCATSMGQGRALGEINVGSNTCLNVLSHFMYWRGGFRVVIQFTQEPDCIRYEAYWHPGAIATTGIYARPANTDVIWSHLESIQGKILDLMIPYVNKYRCNVVWDFNNVYHEDEILNGTLKRIAIAVSLLNPDGTPQSRIATVYLGGADDLIAGYQMPVIPRFLSMDYPTKVIIPLKKQK